MKKIKRKARRRLIKMLGCYYKVTMDVLKLIISIGGAIAVVRSVLS